MSEPLIVLPGDEVWIALTVKQEAEGEPYMGKLGVAYVIRNRMVRANKSASEIVFAPNQFSCWNTESGTRLRLYSVPDDIWEECTRATMSAMMATEPDPTAGATHYLNEELTRKLRGGTLPKWFGEMEVTIRIAKHTFLKVSAGG